MWGDRTLTAPARQVEKFIRTLDQFLEAVAKTLKRRAVASLEERLERLFARYFRKQGRLIMAGTAKLRRRSQVAPTEAVKRFGGYQTTTGAPARIPARLREADEGLPDLDEVLEELVKAGSLDAALIEAVTGILESALSAGADAALKSAGFSLTFDLTSAAAVDFLKARGAELVAGITETTRAALRDLVVAAVKDGKSYTDLAGEISSTFSGFSDARAHTIAVTEVGNAYEEGALLASQELAAAGLQMEKAWLTAGDDKVEEECQGNAEAGWIALGDDFPSGDARPLAHPNCRCTMLSRRKPAEKETTH